MLGILLMLLAIWLFFRFVIFIFRMSFGLFKVLAVILAVALWPVSIMLLLSMGLAFLALPVIVICGICDLIGKAVS